MPRSLPQRVWRPGSPLHPHMENKRQGVQQLHWNWGRGVLQVNQSFQFFNALPYLVILSRSLSLFVCFTVWNFQSFELFRDVFAFVLRLQGGHAVLLDDNQKALYFCYNAICYRQRYLFLYFNLFHSLEFSQFQSFLKIFELVLRLQGGMQCRLTTTRRPCISAASPSAPVSSSPSAA